MKRIVSLLCAASLSCASSQAEEIDGATDAPDDTRIGSDAADAGDAGFDASDASDDATEDAASEPAKLSCLLHVRPS